MKAHKVSMMGDGPKVTLTGNIIKGVQESEIKCSL